MDQLGDPLPTNPFPRGWVCTVESKVSWRFGFIENLDLEFGNNLVWSQTPTQSDGLELLQILVTYYMSDAMPYSHSKATDLIVKSYYQMFRLTVKSRQVIVKLRLAELHYSRSYSNNWTQGKQDVKVEFMMGYVFDII
jgi:hypothetical protein